MERNYLVWCENCSHCSYSIISSYFSINGSDAIFSRSCLVTKHLQCLSAVYYFISNAGEYFFYASYWSDDWSSFWCGRYDSSSGGRLRLEKGYDVIFAFFSNLSRCSGRYRHFYPFGYSSMAVISCAIYYCCLLNDCCILRLE